MVPNVPDNITTVSHDSRRKRRPKEIEYELAANRKIVTRLRNFGLYEGAVRLQRRAFDLKDELAMDCNVPFHDEDKRCMKEELAEILVQCRTESYTHEAISILQELLDLELATQGNATDVELLAAPSTTTRPPPGSLGLRHRLGQLCKETSQFNRAIVHLKIVFDSYAYEDPKDTQKIKSVGDLLLELHEYLVQFGGADQREIFVSQLKGFMSELEDVTGHPLEHRSQCDAALDWCRDEHIPVPEANNEYRFDIIGEDGSSPMHHAAQKCNNASVISQMLENSDTLENQDGNGDTPLLVAVGSSNTTALRLLLQKGGSLSARDRQRQTPLHRSQRSGVTRLLLQHRIRRASTAATADLIQQARRDSSSSSSTATTTTVSPGASLAPTTQDLDINAQDATKKTALYLACARGREMAVNLLLLAGADPNVAAHDHSPLAATVESRSKVYLENPQRQVDVVAALISKGADARSVRSLGELQRPKGKFREIQKALEGRAGCLPLPLSNMSFDVWDSTSDRTSGDQASLSSSSAMGIRLGLTDLGPSSLADVIDPSLLASNRRE